MREQINELVHAITYIREFITIRVHKINSQTREDKVKDAGI